MIKIMSESKWFIKALAFVKVSESLISTLKTGTKVKTRQPPPPNFHIYFNKTCEIVLIIKQQSSTCICFDLLKTSYIA